MTSKVREVILQHILLPSPETCTLPEMYYRSESVAHTPRMDEASSALIFRRGDAVTFDSYFNSFSLAKWRKYTNVRDVQLRLRLRGDFQIQTLVSTLREGKARREVLETAAFRSETPTDVLLSFPESVQEGMLGFSLRATSAEAALIGGCFLSGLPEESLRSVDLALSICTYRREAFVARNLRKLRASILENGENPLSRHMKVYISDNGQTLDIPALSGEKIHIVKNRNLGGTGGFTRNLLEIMHEEAFSPTHVLFMDDDIVIEPEAIYRTWALLTCRKTEHQEAFVGGAMLRLDQPQRQEEAGATWNGGNVVSLKQGYDLTRADLVLENDREEPWEYNAWWFCCVPRSVIRPDNLPLPVFIRGDDVEYGLRNMKDLILLNGICVWHETFENKYSASLSYYILRNLLYANALHAPHDKRLAQHFLWRHTLREIIYFRYDNLELVFRAMEDFLRGVDFLKNTDAEQLHREIMARGCRVLPAEQLRREHPEFFQPDGKPVQTDSSGNALLRALTLNGLILPTHRKAVVSMAQCGWRDFYRAKYVLHFEESVQKGFFTERSLGKTFAGLFRLLGLSLRVQWRYTRCANQFRARAGELTAEESWVRYLGL